MNAGLVLSWYRYEIEATATTSVSRTGDTVAEDTTSGAATLCNNTVDQTSAALQSLASVSASVEQDGGTGAYTRKWGVTFLGSSFEASASGDGSPRSTLEFENLKVYQVPLPGQPDVPIWKVTWTQATWYRDGTLDRTFGSGFVNGAHFAPSGVPFLGIPALLLSSSSITPQPALGIGGGPGGGSTQAEQQTVPAYSEVSNVVTDAVHEIEDPFLDAISAPYDVNASRHASGTDNPAPQRRKVTVSGTAAGGWRFKPESGGAWITPPVTVSATGFIATPGTCACNPGAPTVGGSTTFDLTASSYSEVDYVALDTRTERRSGSVWGFPAWTKALRRMNSGYRVLLRRYAMLGAARRQTAQCGRGEIDPDVCQVDLTSTFPHDVLAAGGVTFGRLAHFAVEIANYVNFNCSPLWSFLVDYPIDGSDIWKVAGVAENASTYWVPLREQWMFQPSLPGAEKYRTRNSIVSEPLFNSYYGTQFIPVTTGQITSWWGISRFDKMSYTVPSTFAYASANSGLFSAVSDCSLAFGANITVTLDGGKTSCVVRLDLASFSADPFMLPQLAEKTAVEWSDGSAAVVSVDVYVENPHGDKALLTSASSATAVRRPDAARADSKYAGSWGQDHGLGTVTDTGTDSTGAGESATVMAFGSEERVHAFQLIAGYGAKYLRFEIAVDSAGGTMNLEYPVLTLATTSAKVVIENGHWAAIVWDDGPGVRFGQWDWTNGTLFQSPPFVSKLGVPGFPVGGKKSSITDALCFKHVMLEGNVASAAAVDADVAALYDTTEAPSQNFVDADDIDVHAFVLPDPKGAAKAGLFILVNSRREVPPAICLPVQARTGDYERSLTQWGLTSLSFVQSPRKIVYRSAGSVVSLTDPADGSVWTSEVPVALGWKAAVHDREVDNDEAATFLLKRAGVELAKVSPWHGYFCVLDTGPGASPANLHRPQGPYMRATVEDGDVWFRQANFSVPDLGFDNASRVTTTGKDGQPHFAIDLVTGSIVLRWTRDDPAGTFKVYEALSDDEGASWSTETMVITNAKHPRVLSLADGTMAYFAFRHNSGSSGPGKILVRVQKAGETSPSAEKFLVDDLGADLEFEDDTFDLHEGSDGAATVVMVALVKAATSVSEHVSYDDGQSFEAVP